MACGVSRFTFFNTLATERRQHVQYIHPFPGRLAAGAAGLELEDVSGLAYLPWRNAATLTSRTDVNYIACARKPE